MDELRELPVADWFQTALLLFDRRKRYRVEGDSMLPTLENGEQVIIHENVEFEIGDIVVARHPFISNIEMIKRISSIDENGNFFLIGDNPPESTDSRSFGAVSIECIKGKVVARLK